MKLISLPRCAFPFFLLAFFAGSFYAKNCLAQYYPPRYYNQSDTLNLYRRLGNFKYYQDRISLKPSKVSALMEDYPVALRSFKKARRRSGWGKVLKIVGGASIGYAVSEYIAPHYFYPARFPWIIAATGAAMVGVSFPIGSSGAKYALNAAHTYNESVKKEKSSSLKLDFHQKRAGFAFTLIF